MVSGCESRLVGKSIKLWRQRVLPSFSLNHQASSYAGLGDDTQEKYNILEDRIREYTTLTEVVHCTLGVMFADSIL